MWTAGRAALVVLSAVCGVALPAAPARAQADLEYAVKANYLVRFAAFVAWPPRAFSSPDAPVVICIAGRDPFGGVLDSAARGQSAHGRPLAVRRLREPTAVSGCNIVYVGRDGGPAVGAAAGQPALVVTDQAAGAGRGAIHFVIAQARVRFHIDQQQASRNGVEISSRLLKLAISVRAR